MCPLFRNLSVEDVCSGMEKLRLYKRSLKVTEVCKYPLLLVLVNDHGDNHLNLQASVRSIAIMT